MNTVLYTLISGLLLSPPAGACGTSKDGSFANVPLSFSTIEPSFNELKLRLKADSKYGWRIEDRDGAAYFFRPLATGSSEPCLQLDKDSSPVCGRDQIENLKNRVSGGAFKQKIGNRLIALLDFTYGPRPSILVKSPGQNSPYREISITPDLKNLDNTNFQAGIKIEALDDYKTVGSVTARRSMVSKGGELAPPPQLGRCITIESTASHSPVEMRADVLFTADLHGNISSASALNKKDGAFPARVSPSMGGTAAR